MTTSAFFYEVRDLSGSVVRDAPITINNTDNSLATIYDESGNEVDNPIFTRSDGLALCYLTDGTSYNLVINNTNILGYTHNGGSGGGGGASITGPAGALIASDGSGNGVGTARAALTDADGVSVIVLTGNMRVTGGAAAQQFDDQDSRDASWSAFANGGLWKLVPSLDMTQPAVLAVNPSGLLGVQGNEAGLNLGDQDGAHSGFKIQVNAQVLSIVEQDTSTTVLTLDEGGNLNVSGGVSVAGVSIGAAKYIVIQDQDTNGVGRTASAAAQWVDRPLSTIVQDDTAAVTLTGNVINLPAGTYEVDAWGTFGTGGPAVGRCKLYLANNDAALALLVGGSSSYSSVAQSGLCVINGTFTLSVPTNVSIQSWIAGLTGTSADYGVPGVSGMGDELYCSVTFKKVA